MLAANVGAVIMPWMIFYQQSSVVDKNLNEEDLYLARVDTAVGCVLTQGIMIAVIVTAAVYLPGQTGLGTAGEVGNAFATQMGPVAGHVIYGLGLVGGAMVAAIVVGLAAAWGLGEVMGYPKSLNNSISEAPQFYAVYGSAALVGNLVALSCSDGDVVQLMLLVNVVNSLMLGPVLFFLYGLARHALPDGKKLEGIEAVVVAVVMTTGVLTCWGATLGSIIA